MTDKLRECPFKCKHFSLRVIDRGLPSGVIAKSVKCTRCLTLGPIGVTSDKAIEAWNRRHHGRCQDCRYAYKYEDGGLACTRPLGKQWRSVGPDFYCAKWEKKDDTSKDSN